MAINIQRLTYDFGASENSVAIDISAEGLTDVASTTYAFARVTNTLFSATEAAGTTTDANNDDLSITCLLTDTGTVTLTRESGGANHDVRVYIEIWEDDSSGGADGFTVQYHDNVLIANDQFSASQAVTFTTQADCTPIIGGISGAYGSGSYWPRSAVVAEMTVSGVDLSRSNKIADTTVSLTVVEWGSNYSVQNNISHGFSSAATTETETITAVTWADTFIFGSFKPKDDQPADNANACLIYPGSTSTTISFYMASGGATGATEAIAHIVEHADVAVEHEDSVDGAGAALGSSGTAPKTDNITLGTTLSDLGAAAAIAFSITGNTSTDPPKNHINYRLTSTSNFEFWRARTGSAHDWAYQVIDFSGIGGGGNVSVNIPAASMSLASYAPSVTATDNKTLDIPSASLSLTSYAPTVTATDDKTVQPGTAGITATGLAPTIATTENITLAPEVGTITATGLAPTVQATDNKTLEPGAATISANGLAPTIATSASKTIQVPTATISASGLTPTINATDSKTLEPATSAMTITGLAPTVTSSADKTIEPGAASVTAAGLTPAIATTENKTIEPQLATITATGLTPTIIAPITIAPPVSSMAIAGLAPTITTGQIVKDTVSLLSTITKQQSASSTIRKQQSASSAIISKISLTSELV